MPYESVRTRIVHINELQHDRTNKLTCAPSEDSDQPGQGVLHADSEGSDHTVWLPSLIRVFAGYTGHFVGFVALRLKWQ